jgi:hypothetical protein
MNLSQLLANSYYWQALIGGFLAVFAAGLSAVLVVMLTRWATRRSSAHFVFLELIRFRNHMEALLEETDRRANTGVGHPRATAMFARNRVPLSRVFEEQAVHLASVDIELGLLLSQFQSFYAAAENYLSLYLRLDDQFIMGGPLRVYDFFE